MIYTARQIEDLWKANGSNGQVVLPYRARLSPLAADWVKSKMITLGYADAAAANPKATSALPHVPAAPSAHPYFYWCDGPCGTAKAALTAQARESSLSELPIPNDPGRLIAAIKHLATQLKSQSAAGGILLVNSGASALVFANRCPSLRAIVGTCLQTVEEGIQQVAANVLIIEYPHQTLQQIRNLLARFVKAQRTLSDQTQQSLKELAACA